jgi:hypothetical protein
MWGVGMHAWLPCRAAAIVMPCQTLLPSEAHRKEKLKRAVDWIGRYEKTIAPIVGASSSISAALQVSRRFVHACTHCTHCTRALPGHHGD